MSRPRSCDPPRSAARCRPCPKSTDCASHIQVWSGRGRNLWLHLLRAIYSSMHGARFLPVVDVKTACIPYTRYDRHVPRATYLAGAIIAPSHKSADTQQALCQKKGQLQLRLPTHQSDLPRCRTGLQINMGGGNAQGSTPTHLDPVLSSPTLVRGKMCDFRTCTARNASERFVYGVQSRTGFSCRQSRKGRPTDYTTPRMIACGCGGDLL